MKATATPRHPWLAVGAGALSLSALAGATALATGTMDMGPAISSRFPLGSAVLGGLALAAIVGLPMAAAAYLTGAGHAWAAEAAMAAGSLLVAWIAVQILIIRTFSWLQPVMALAGAAVFLGGWLIRHKR